MNARRNGFTIVEVMVVVIILGMLAAFIVPGVFKKVGKAKTKIARSQMALIEGQLEQFAIDCGRLPTDDEGLGALLSPPAGLEETWGPKYLKDSQINDPWDRPYIYVSQGTINTGSYDLICLGADGEEGGEGDNADIFND
ncbi:MAG: type II secretion system major pseudopilin GspG [Phycisphaerae bacterium]|nr:type II secretion system major pseudopilin GspG [Phycisphaerae bacterium]